MPYPRAYIYVAVLLLLTFPAFWLNYYSQLSAVPWQFHLHGVSATLWMLLLISQSWSIHHGRRALHRRAGLATFVLTPVFLAGSLLVIGSMAAGGGPFRAMFGTRLSLADVIAFLAFTALIYGALRHRSNVALALALYARNRRAKPFLAVAIVIAVQSLVFETAGRTVIWSDINGWLGSLSEGALAGFAVLLGIAATGFGWINGRVNR